jgi:hypothetical protein
MTAALPLALLSSSTAREGAQKIASTNKQGLD